MSEFAKVVSVDPIVAESLFGSNNRNGPASAERELMVAVLSDAIECYWKYQKSRKRSEIRLYQDARSWIFADNENLPYSFSNVCETLQLDPAYIRRGILAPSGAPSASDGVGVDGLPNGARRNIKRKLKSGREWKGGSRLSRGRVRPLRVRPRSQ